MAQCASGYFSSSAATSCTPCGAGKYLTSAAGGTEAASCTSVSIVLMRHTSSCRHPATTCSIRPYKVCGPANTRWLGGGLLDYLLSGVQHQATHDMDVDTYVMCLQCPVGWFSASGASVCTACSAGKYLTNASGGTEAASCTSVSSSCMRVWMLQATC